MLRAEKARVHGRVEPALISRVPLVSDAVELGANGERLFDMDGSSSHATGMAHVARGHPWRTGGFRPVPYAVHASTPIVPLGLAP